MTAALPCEEIDPLAEELLAVLDLRTRCRCRRTKYRPLWRNERPCPARKARRSPGAAGLGEQALAIFDELQVPEADEVRAKLQAVRNV
jgi:hypothetical protein